MRSLLLTCGSALLSVTLTHANAQSASPASPPQPLVNQRPLNFPSQPNTTPRDDRPRVAPKYQQGDKGQQQAQRTHLTDDDLKHNLKLTEMILNQAMLREDWDTITSIMAFYPRMEGRDAILEGYVKGALERHNGHYGTAVNIYKQLLQQQPDLDYVRLELASTWFDDRAYANAERQFHYLANTPLEPAAQRDIFMYRQAMVNQQKWNVHASLGRMFDNNVNSANRDHDIYFPQRDYAVIGDDIYYSDVYWVPFGKDRGSRPYKDWGTTYDFSADTEKNINGHHYYTLSASLYGTAYDHHTSYNDNTLLLSAGYKFQTARHWLSFTPMVSKRWWGSPEFSTSYGATLEYGYRPSNDWQLVISDTFLRERYDAKDYKDYNGNVNTLSMLAVHAFTPSFALFGGINYQHESTREDAYGSSYPALRLGASVAAGNWLGGTLSTLYGRQRYSAPYAVFADMKRRDRTLSVNASLWTPKLAFQGITPKLNLDYQRVNSSIRPYTRDQMQVSVTLSKDW